MTTLVALACALASARLARAELPQPAALPHTMTALIHRGDDELTSHAEDGKLALVAGDRLELSFRLLGDEGSAATFVVSGLPLGARADSAPNGVDVVWSPGDADAGTHKIFLHAADGASTADRELDLFVDSSATSFMAPGARATVWVPNAIDALGAFVGGGAQITLVSWVQRGHRWWPSHGRVYALGDLIASPRASKPAFDVGAGFDLSLERDPARRFLIPFVGAEAGVTFCEATGTFGWAEPRAGLYLWSSRSVRVEIDAGYLLPTTAAQDVRGGRFAMGIDVAPW